MSCVKFVSQQQKASAGGDSFEQQDGVIAQQNLAMNHM